MTSPWRVLYPVKITKTVWCRIVAYRIERTGFCIHLYRTAQEDKGQFFENGLNKVVNTKNLKQDWRETLPDKAVIISG